MILAVMTHNTQAKAIPYNRELLFFSAGTILPRSMMPINMAPSEACPEGKDLNVSSRGLPSRRYHGEKRVKSSSIL